MHDPTSAELRRRAGALRRLAHAIDTSSLHQLAGRAGEDTWRGPAAQTFGHELRVARRSLDDATEELVGAAIRLEHEARQLDLDAAVA